MKRVVSAGIGGLALALASAATAHAHSLGAEGAGLIHGFVHPLGGLDHLLAMIAVGLWAGQTGGRAMWFVPAAFLAMLTAGALAGFSGMIVPAVEAGIAVSVLVLGLLIAAQQRLGLAAGMALVGFFAIFHGHAHGAEMPAAGQPLFYGFGFLAATALLHGAGILLMNAGRSGLGMRAMRFGGAAVAAAGFGLIVGL